MSARLAHSLTDENPDLRKQIGCMNGFFQLFDRNHLLSGRRINGHNHKRLLPPGHSADHGMKSNSATKKTMENNQENVMKDKQRVSVESSSTSFSSSSCSSTFSSVDCNKTAPPEPSSFSQCTFPETPSLSLPMKQPNSSLHLGRQSLDLRDIVKDSMYGEALGVSVKTMAKEEGICRVLKHIDSPRPLQQSDPVQPRCVGFDGSVRVIAKLREASWSSREEKDGSPPSAPKDIRRFSYDGRESRDTLKSTMKLKELPRLSLDSREGSMRGSASESRSNYLLRDLQRGDGNSSQILDPHQDPGSNKRPSSVVAKLMGLEAFPDFISSNECQTMKIKSCPDEDFNTTSRSPRAADKSKQNRVLGSPGISHKDPESPRFRNANSVVKPTPRFPIEPAPWKQPGSSRGSQKPVFKHRDVPATAPHVAPSVYGEIEKRLTGLEFKKSGKDLRALKQILEAMQKTRVRLENKNEEQAWKSDSQTCRSFHQVSRLSTRQSQQSNYPISPTIKGTSPSKIFESSIVIMKPAKVIEKPRLSGSSMIPTDGISGLRKLRTGHSADKRKFLADKQTAKDLTPRNNHLTDPSSRPVPSMDKKTNTRTLRLTQTLKVPQQLAGENPTSFERSSATVSPRLQQKQHEVEKPSRPTTPTSNLSRARKQSGKQPIESGSPSRRPKPKFTNLQKADDQSSEVSTETRNSSQQGDTVSVRSESNISSVLQIDTEVTSTDRSNEINHPYQQKEPRYKNSAAILNEAESMAGLKLATVTLEQPSPVSVLDATFYREDSPSPVKKISNAFQDDETLNSQEAEWNPLDLVHLPYLSSEFDHNKLEEIKHLVHKLRVLNSTHDEATTDCTASLHENTNSDHSYICEMLLASGFLKDQGFSSTTVQLYPSGHLINPNLELMKGSTETEHANSEHNEKIAQSKFNNKMQRKLLFDTVTEIIVHKLATAGSSEPWISPNNLGRRRLSGQQLLKELCLEIDRLQTHSECSLDDEDDGMTSILSADMTNQSETWIDYHGEFPGLVLDIERLIFKDLICEVVGGEVACLKDRPRRRRRQLFSK